MGAVLDSDDAMAPGLLAALRTALAEHPGYDWFIGKHREWQPDGTLTEHPGLHLTPGPFESADYAARLRALYAAGHWSVWKYCLRRAWLREDRLHFWNDVRWAEDWPFDLLLLTRCTRLYFLDVVFTHYRTGRTGSLMTDARNLPRRFASLAAAQRHLAALAATDRAAGDAWTAMQDAMADVFWPQARTGLKQLRPLYAHGAEVRTRRDWRAFQAMMRLLGPRLTLWLCAKVRRADAAEDPAAHDGT